jgi:hypothetical protein
MKNANESILVTNEKSCFFCQFYFRKIDFGHFKNVQNAFSQNRMPDFLFIFSTFLNIRKFIENKEKYSFYILFIFLKSNLHLYSFFQIFYIVNLNTSHRWGRTLLQYFLA